MTSHIGYERNFWYFTSMNSSQPSRLILKPLGPLGPKADNIYMFRLDRYKLYHSRSPTSMWGSVSFSLVSWGMFIRFASQSHEI